MRKLPLVLPALLLLGIGGKCSGGGQDYFWNRKCAVFHTTTNGLTWRAYGPSTNLPHPALGNQPDDLRYQDVQGISDALDAAVDQVAQAYSAVGIWAFMRTLEIAVVDDYAFPDYDLASDFPAATYASGLTFLIGNQATGCIFALWSRHNLAPTDPEPTNVPAPWCLRGPGINGYNYWRYGDFPMVPAVGYELRVNVFHVASN